MFLGEQVVNDAATACATPPRGALPFQSLYITLKGIFLHGEENCPNACLIFCREL